MLLSPGQLIQCSWTARCEDTTALVHGSVCFCRVGSSSSGPGGNLTLSQTHQALLPLELPEDIVGMVQPRFCGAKQLEMPRLHKNPETTDHIPELSSVSQPVPLLLDKIPRAKCGLVVSLPVRSPLRLNFAGLTGSELIRTLEFPPLYAWSREGRILT